MNVDISQSLGMIPVLYIVLNKSTNIPICCSSINRIILGVTPSLRPEVWKFLLDYFPWSSTETERQKLQAVKSDEYYNMKLQWKRMTKVQEDNFSDYRERKSLIEKDVNRTDRTLDFYAGDNNANLQTLNDILMTYIMYNFDLGYVQGMSDLLSPILMLLDNEVDSFWCFVGFMNKVEASTEYTLKQIDDIEDIIDANWEKIKNNIEEAATEALEKRKVILNKRYNNNTSWFRKEIKEKCKEKREAYTKYKTSNTQESRDTYRRIRNETKQLVRRTKNEYWE
ncbi:unnamed protein product [Diabrotica balteata]|uniref:Rab-GAP TBC domain-containing protein n=1 Tax=Diabrotica balteata TaxID=107213 RepID=A0A9N9XGX4_DIABA|nr:unnamed protein product [Diabrotica balteata]